VTDLAKKIVADIASFYSIRLQRVPDRFIAALGAMKPQVLMTADELPVAPAMLPRQRCPVRKRGG